jgi:hypothetical protein
MSVKEVNVLFGIDIALQKLRPNAKYTLVNTEIIKWEDPNGLPPPNWKEIEQIVEEDRKQNESLQYARDRKAAYASLEDQLDMIWSDMQKNKIAFQDSIWYNSIKEIKEKYPKPE